MSDPTTRTTAAHTTFRLWVIDGVLSLRCSCGWTQALDNGVEFGPVGHAATTHQREAHDG
jgi:hypothetical protein